MPILRLHLEGARKLWPIVQGSRIEVRAIRPHQRVTFRIEAHLSKYPFVPQRRKQVSAQYRQKIDHLAGKVVESNAQYMVSDDVKAGDLGDEMLSHDGQFSGSIGRGR